MWLEKPGQLVVCLLCSPDICHQFNSFKLQSRINQKIDRTYLQKTKGNLKLVVSWTWTANLEMLWSVHVNFVSLGKVNFERFADSSKHLSWTEGKISNSLKLVIYQTGPVYLEASCKSQLWKIPSLIFLGKVNFEMRTCVLLTYHTSACSMTCPDWKFSQGKLSENQQQ